MKLQRNECVVTCPKCFQILGVVTAVQEVDARPGVWVNYSNPAKIPKLCTNCDGHAERVPHDGSKDVVTIVEGEVFKIK